MIAIASDHAGYPLKEEIKKHLDEQGIAYTAPSIRACITMQTPFVWAHVLSVRALRSNWSTCFCTRRLRAAVTSAAWTRSQPLKTVKNCIDKNVFLRLSGEKRKRRSDSCKKQMIPLL